MQRLEFSGEVRPIYGSLGVKRLIIWLCTNSKVRSGRAADHSPPSSAAGMEE